jgi:hypothetical protein
MAKDKHGKGRNDDWEKEQESIETYDDCARGRHQWSQIQRGLVQCLRCGAVKGS